MNKILKKTRREKQNSHFKGFSATFLIGVMLLIVLFSITFACAAEWTEALDNGLVAYYDFENETAAVTNLPDIIRGKHNATLTGTNTHWTTGLIGEGFNCDGSDKFVINDHDDFSFPEMSLSIWVKPTTIANKYVMQQWDGAGDRLQFYLTSAQESILTTFKIGGTSTDILSDDKTGLNVWSHWVLVYNTTDVILYVNGTQQTTVDSLTGTFNSASNIFICTDRNGADGHQGLIDEVGFWNRTLSATEIENLYNNGNGLEYGEGKSIKIELISPEDNSNLFDIGENFTVNYTSVGYNFTNVTYYVWDSTGIFNNSVVVNITGTENSTTEYIDDFGLGNYKWNVWTCYENNSGDSNCTWADENYSLFVGASIDTEKYNNITYETSKEVFIVNLTLLNNTNFYDAQLEYNKILYEGVITDLGSNKYSISASLDIPLYTCPSFNWHWKLTYETDTGFIFQNLTTHTQNISEINLSVIGCTAAENITLNFTAYDEEDLTQINGFSFDATFQYWLGSGSIKKNFSISNSSVENNLPICINPNNLTYYSNTQIQYEKSGFVKRSHYLINSSLTNTTNNIKLYLLNSSSSTSFIINVIDSFQFSIVDAYVYIQRYYPGTGVFHTIEMAKTDSSGNTVGHFEAETEDYKVLIFKDGTLLYESDKAKVFCGETPCTLNFQTEAAIPTTWINTGDLANLIWSLTYNEATKIWTYTYIDTSGTTKWGRLLVYTEDGNSKTIICNNSDTSSAATLTCNVTNYEGTIYAKAYISRSPEILVWSESVIKRVVKAIFGMEGVFWAMMILLTIGLVGIWHPTISVIMMIVGIILINFLQIASFGITTIMGITIIGIIILMEMKRT